jgi:hypothetical protein
MMLLYFIQVKEKLLSTQGLTHQVLAHGLWLVYSSMDDPLADVA